MLKPKLKGKLMLKAKQFQEYTLIKTIVKMSNSEKEDHNY